MIVHHRGKIVAIRSHEIIGQEGTVHLLNRYLGELHPARTNRTTKRNNMFFMAVIDFGINTFRSPLTSKAPDPCEDNLRLQNSSQLPLVLLYCRKAGSR